ncbi:MAG: hypothetical protein QXR02_06650 [Acidilobaceae archaeon]
MSKQYWIQKAIKKPGALREWLKRNAKKVRKVIKGSPFTKRGKIKVSALRKIKKAINEGKLKVSRRTKARINLAITLARMRKTT